MNMWVALVIIVMVTMGAAVIMKRYETLGRAERAKGRSDDDDRRLAEQRDAEQRELAELRERIKVLERIATDNNTSTAVETRRVADEIEALRDRQHS